MKKLILVIAALLVVFSSPRADVVAQKHKTVKSPFAEQYQALKKSLDIDKEELSTTEALEAVSVKFSEMLDRADKALAWLATRTDALEKENNQLRAQLVDAEKRIKELESRTDELENRANGFDGDLDKLFTWMNKANDDLYNEISISPTAVGAKLKRLDNQVNNWWTGLNTQMDEVRSAVNINTKNIQTLWNAIHR